jgi:hypothetical protein
MADLNKYYGRKMKNKSKEMEMSLKYWQTL